MHEHHADPVTAAIAGSTAVLVELAANSHAFLAWSEDTALAALRAALVGAFAALVVTLLSRRWPHLFGRGQRNSVRPPPPSAPSNPSER